MAFGGTKTIMKEIKTSNGHTAFVDDEDFKQLSQYIWWGDIDHKTVYCRRTNKKGVSPRIILMHREILGLVGTKGVVVDHKDRNGLNNTKNNLRTATMSQNLGNSCENRKRISKYKGVTLCRKTNKWRAHISINYKKYHLGYFHSQEAAAMAYNKAALAAWGEFARINPINEPIE